MSGWYHGVMASPAPRLITLDQYLAMPETEPATELIDGRLEQKPLGRYRHGRAQTRLAQALGRFPATELGEAITELTVRFPTADRPNARIPDVSYWLPGNVPDPDQDYPDEAPDLAAEVLSKDQSRRSVQQRLEFLRRSGSACTLLIDPWARTIEVCDGPRSWIAREDDEVRLQTLAGFTFRPRELFD